MRLYPVYWCRNTIKLYWLLTVTFLLVCSSTSFLSAQSLRDINNRIQNGIDRSDTLYVKSEFEKAHQFLSKDTSTQSTLELLRFRYLTSRYNVKFSKIEIDSGLAEYERIHTACSKYGYHELNARVLRRLANGSRSKRQLGKAYEFNQKAISAAQKSNNSLLVGWSLITELDISYNALPWPLQKNDLELLIEKGKTTISYAMKHDLKEIELFGTLYMSKFYIKQNELSKALDLLLAIEDTEDLAVVFSKYEHLCEIAKLQNNKDDYREYAQKFKKYARATNRRFVILNANNYLLDYSMTFGVVDSANHYADRLEADLKVVDTTKYLDFLDVSYTTLARHFEDKNPEKQLKYTALSAAINKVMLQRQREAYIAIERYKSDLESLESSNIALSESQSLVQKNLKRVLIISSGLALLLFFIYHRYRKSKNEAASAVMEKQLLSEKVKQKSIILQTKQRIYLDELVVIKADRNYIEVFTSDKKYLDRSTLTQMIQRLPPNFYQVHRSYVINSNFISSVTASYILLKTGQEIPFSRTFRAKLKHKL